jgi:hypothetical protein
MFGTREIPNPSNNPSDITLEYIKTGDIYPNITVKLPEDTITKLDGEKIIAENKILDGAFIYERVSIKPFQIDFEFTLRRQNIDYFILIDPNKYVFPQFYAETLKELYAVDSIINVTNTYLNGLGIETIIIKNLTLTPVRGSTDILGTLKCFENYNNPDSSSLLIPV